MQHSGAQPCALVFVAARKKAAGIEAANPLHAIGARASQRT